MELASTLMTRGAARIEISGGPDKIWVGLGGGLVRAREISGVFWLFSLNYWGFWGLKRVRAANNTQT